MRIARFSRGDSVSFGVIDGDPEQPASLTVTGIAGHPFAPFQLAGEPTPLAEVRLLAPVLPSKVIGVGKNYAEHVREMGGDEAPPVPPIFIKPSTSVIGPSEAISLPKGHGRVDHEAELAVVIGRLCRDVPAARVKDVILGYTCGNDVTDRDLQKSDGQWSRAKGADTFCPLGPWIDTTLDPSAVPVQAHVNGEVRQDGTTADLLTGIADLVALVSATFTLLPGDVILTGTPAGVGPISEGDEVSVRIGGIGTLTNRVVARD
jgi:2-keto-4-pentenoate hydratase/2-oxohepta-3-ene-1,7-dioic acid hydratase in catechol pathway